MTTEDSEVIPELVKLTKHGSVGDAVCSHVHFGVFHTTGVKAYIFPIKRREWADAIQSVAAPILERRDCH